LFDSWLATTELYRIFGVDLTNVAGLGAITAQTILREIGTDVSLYPSYEVLTFAPMGLPPTEHISLSLSFSGHAEAQ